MNILSPRGRRRWPQLQVFRIHLGVFDYSVHVAIGPQEQGLAYIRWFTKMPTVDENLARRGLCALSQPYCPIIWIPQRPKTAREHATLAHECLHAVGHVMRWAAIEHSEATEEVFCHTLGCLVDGILKHARRNGAGR